MWTKGTANGLTYTAKVYEEGSEFGINEGRISKLELRDENNQVVANYDRGWDLKPNSARAREALKMLLAKYC